MKQHDIIIHTNAAVTEVTKHSVKTAEGEYPSDITVWTAGFKNFAPDMLNEAMCMKGQIHVNDRLHHPEVTSLYALGDIACLHNEHDKPLPMLAQVAHQQGIYLGKQLAKLLRNKTYQAPPFRYHSHGTIMPIGDWFGVALFGNMIFKGRIMWFLRRTTYLLFLPGIVRKLRTVADWTLQTFGSRQVLHIEPEEKKRRVEISS